MVFYCILSEALHNSSRIKPSTLFFRVYYYQECSDGSVFISNVEHMNYLARKTRNLLVCSYFLGDLKGFVLTSHALIFSLLVLLRKVVGFGVKKSALSK